MDFRDVTLQAITDFSEQLDAALDGLTPEQWRWRPTPSANHIMWIVWHLTRVEDMWINSYLAEADQVWEKRGWADKINMPAEDRFGVGDTPEQVGAFPDVAPELIAGYRADVLASVGPVIRGLTESDLPTTRPEKNPLRPRADFGRVLATYRTGGIHPGPDAGAEKLAGITGRAMVGCRSARRAL